MVTHRIVTASIALAGCLFAPNPLTAQVEAVDVHLGVARSSMGGGFADLADNAGYDLISRTGFVAGASIDYGLPSVHERLSIRAGLGVAQKGNRIEYQGEDFRLLDITYLEVPVLAVLSLGRGAWRSYAVAGPVLSFKQGTYAEIDGRETDADDELKGSDVGLGLGVGARRDRLGAEVRYVHGFPNVTTSPDPDEGATNRQWSFALTYRIAIGR